MVNPKITSPYSVCRDGKAIRSESVDGVIWFYMLDQEPVVMQDGDVDQIDWETIKANVTHQDTEIETVPVEESPFSDIEEPDND